MAKLADYAWLTSDVAAAWLARLADDARSELQRLAALRRELPVERARLIVEQVALRRRAVEKFGDLATRMFFTRVHLEQATDLWIARHKANRLATGTTIGDYCCGVGGDLLALAERGGASGATGWDLSPTACLLAEANLRGAATVRCGDVEQHIPANAETWHLDPDRRAGGRRTTTVADYAPGPALVERWLASAPGGAVKLAPAAVAPDSWALNAELEWISQDRECRQQVAWFGPLTRAAGQRRATVVGRSGDVASLVGQPDIPCEPAYDPGRYIYDPDASVLAAGLLGALAAKHELTSLGVGGAYLTGDGQVRDPLAAGLAVRDCLPLRAPMLVRYFADRGIGRLEIKKRGVAIDPETLRRRLKLRGDNDATLILTRVGKRELAIVAERFPA